MLDIELPFETHVVGFVALASARNRMGVFAQDFRGQKMAERLFQVIVTLFGVSERHTFVRSMMSVVSRRPIDRRLHRWLFYPTVQFDHLQCSLRSSDLRCGTSLKTSMSFDLSNSFFLQLTLPAWPMYRNNPVDWIKSTASTKDTANSKASSTAKSPPKKDVRKPKVKKDE